MQPHSKLFFFLIFRFSENVELKSIPKIVVDKNSYASTISYLKNKGQNTGRLKKWSLIISDDSFSLEMSMLLEQKDKIWLITRRISKLTSRCIALHNALFDWNEKTIDSVSVHGTRATNKQKRRAEKRIPLTK